MTKTLRLKLRRAKANWPKELLALPTIQTGQERRIETNNKTLILRKKETIS